MKNRPMLLWTAVAIIAYLLVGLAFAQSTWTQCATEGGTCTLATQKQMRYGEPFNNRWTAARTVVGPIPCTNAYWTDPSPSVGKRCQVKDLDAPIVPLPLGTAKYEITWTPATTNTDGTPIGTIVSTAIQVSDTADFARSLQWLNTGAGTAYFVSQAPNLTTLYWRANHTTANGTSAWTTPAVRTERQVVEASKPVCWPKPVGSGTWVKGEQNTAGWALYWQCTNTAGVAIHAGSYGLWNMMDADWVKQLTAALESGASAFDTLWNTRASGPMDPTSYAAVRPLWEAMRDANPLPTGARYVVKPNGTLTTRPAYGIANGARTSKVAGRVAVLAAPGVGTPCDCAIFRSGDYCAVTGQPNAGTAAVDVLPASAAVCGPVP